jgi:hypothetical protein
VKTDIECTDILKRLGFDVQLNTRKTYDIIFPMTVWSLGAIAVMSIIATVITVQFCNWLECFSYEWIKFPVPQPDGVDLLRIFGSTWATAAYYFMTIMGALVVRITRIGRREWFNINDPKRKIPFMNYPTSVIAGTVLGGVTLFIIALFGPDFHRNPLVNTETALQGAFLALLWLPLAILMALIALSLMDADVSKDPQRWQRSRKFLVRGALGAAIMAVGGGLLSWLSLPAPPEDTMAKIYTSIFLAVLERNPIKLYHSRRH